MKVREALVLGFVIALIVFCVGLTIKRVDDCTSRDGVPVYGYTGTVCLKQSAVR